MNTQASMTRILVVDDDPSVCDVVERLLASSGYAVTTATTGRAALEAATRQPFAAAFVDLCMPTMHGLEIIHGLRSLAPDTKLIVMSGLMADCGGPPAPDFLGMMTEPEGNRTAVEAVRPPGPAQPAARQLYPAGRRTRARARTEDFATAGRACITARPS